METSQSVARGTPDGKIVANLVITELADNEAALIARVDDLESDNKWLRETLHEAVWMLRRNNIQIHRFQSRVVTLVNNGKTLRDEAANLRAMLRIRWRSAQRDRPARRGQPRQRARILPGRRFALSAHHRVARLAVRC